MLTCTLGRTERKRLDLYPRSFQARASVGQLQGPQGLAQAHSRDYGEDRKGLGEQACSARKSTKHYRSRTCAGRLAEG
jgi:hypothetical protein